MTKEKGVDNNVILCTSCQKWDLLFSRQ